MGRGEELGKLSPLLLSWCLRPFGGLDILIPSSPPRPCTVPRKQVLGVSVLS